jgi:hypothetical protein
MRTTSVAAVLLLAVAALVAAAPRDAAPTAASPPPPACRPLDPCPPSSPLPTLDACLADSCACAQQLTCYLGQQDLEAWPVFPQSAPAHLNTGATHGRFVTTRVNPPALTAAEQQIADRSLPADLPSGSLLVKQNYLPDPDDLTKPDPGSVFLTVMYKLDGYCPDGSRQANGDCAGGDWFWSLERFGGFQFTGKPSFCLDCHGAVAGGNGGDWSWQLELFRRFPNAQQEAAR